MIALCAAVCLLIVLEIAVQSRADAEFCATSGKSGDVG